MASWTTSSARSRFSRPIRRLKPERIAAAWWRNRWLTRSWTSWAGSEGYHGSGWPMKSTWRTSTRPNGRCGESEAICTASS